MPEITISPLLFLIGLPILGILAILLLHAPPRATALMFTVAAAASALLVAFGYRGAGVLAFEQVIPWVEMPGIGPMVFRLGVDGFNLPLVVLTALVSVAAVLMAPVAPPRAAEYFAYLLAIVTGAYGMFVATDVLLMYIAHEVALIPTFLMIGIWGNGRQRVGVAYQMAIFLVLGSLILLAGILALVYSLHPDDRTTDLVLLTERLAKAPVIPWMQNRAYLLLLVGFGILVGLFPFHWWAPRGYSAAPEPVAMLHAGVLKKFGIYGLLRVAAPLLPEGAAHWMPWLLALAACNLLYLGWVAIAQKRLNDLVGYSSVMHMGYLFLGVAALNERSLSGVVLLMVAHGLSVAGLFAVTGLVRERTGTVILPDLGGLASRIPFAGYAVSVFAMASVGLPGLANFPGELLVFLGSWQAEGGPLWFGVPALRVMVGVALFGVLLSTVYTLRAVRAVFFGAPGKAAVESGPVSLSNRAGIVILIAGLLAFGFAPSLLTANAALTAREWMGAIR